MAHGVLTARRNTLLRPLLAALPRMYQQRLPEMCECCAGQVWRTEFSTAQRNAILRPPLAALPPNYQQAGSYHLGVHPNDPPLQLLRELRSIVDQHPRGASAQL